jgi:hypothetical protein
MVANQENTALLAPNCGPAVTWSDWPQDHLINIGRAYRVHVDRIPMEIRMRLEAVLASGFPT